MNSHTIKNTLFALFIPLVIISLAIQPLLTGHMPWQGDGLLHYVRLAVLENDVARGDLFPRWSPDLAYGYGFPLFNFYAPFSYYVGLPFRWLDFSLKAATNASYILAMWTLALGGYLWGKDGGQKSSGGFAALLLCYNPYILNNLLHRSALGELWGLAWLMMTMWAIHRLFDGRFVNGRSRVFLIATLCYAFLLLSHNITALIGTPFILGYALFRCLMSDPAIEGYDIPISRQKLTLLLFVPLALALSAFFWLPAFVEKDLVQVERLVDGDNFAYSNHFIPSDIARDGDGFPADAAWLNRPLPWGTFFQWFSITVTSVMTIPLIIYLKVSKKIKDSDGLFWPIGIYFAAWLIPFALTSATSVVIWDRLPLLHFVQFPWRFLGLCAISFMMLFVKLLQTWAFLSNKQVSETAPKATQTQMRWQGILLIFLFLIKIPILGMLIVEEMNIYFWPTPHPALPLVDSQTTAEITAFELQTGWLGTTAAGDYLPRTVQTLPRPEQAPALNPFELTNQPYQVTELTALQFSQFYFSNWRAYEVVPSTQEMLPLELTPSVPYGFLELKLDPGTYLFELRQTATPIQHVGNLISLTVGICLIGYVAFVLRQFFAPLDFVLGRHFPRQKGDEYIYVAVMSITWFLLLVPAGFAVAKTAVLDHRDSAFHVRNQRLKDPVLDVANFDNQIYFLGEDRRNSTRVEQNQVELRLFWGANQPTQDYSVSLQVLDQDGYRYGQSDHLHPGHLPVTRWPENSYISDDHLISLVPGTPLGPYRVDVIIYDEEGRRLDVLNEAGQPVDTTHRVAYIFVEEASSDELVLSYAETVFETPICQDATVCLAGYNLIPLEQVALGDLVPITFFLQRPTGEPRLVPYWLDLYLVNRNTQQRVSLNPAVDSHDRREIVQAREDGQSFYWDSMSPHTRRQEHAFRIPALFDDGSPLSSGPYALYFADTEIGSFDIATPDRLFDAASLPIPVARQLGDLVYLDSASLSQTLTALTAGTPLEVNLLWQPIGTTDQSYKVFVQLLDSDQRVVAQSDLLPSNQGVVRPTISWAPDEYLLDTHVLQLPADLDLTETYTLITGLYNEANGERISVDNEEFNLTYLTIQP